MKRVLLLLAFVFVYSCSGDQLRVDGRDQASFNETIDLIAKELPLLQQSKLKEALDIVYHYKTSPTTSEEQRWAAVRNIVDDKNAEEIFALAEEIATANNFSWTRNQVPLVNGVPKPGSTELVEVESEEEESVNQISRFDFRVKEESSSVKIEPFFFNAEGQELQLEKPVVATIEFFSGGQIILTKKATIDPNSMDALYRNNGIFIPLNTISSKIQNGVVDVLIRIPHPDRYLTQRKTLALSGYEGDQSTNAVQDSVAKVVNKDVKLMTNLTQRFLTNLSNKNYSAAYALTRNSEWNTFQKFSSSSAITALDGAKVKDTQVLDADEKVVILESNVVLNDDSSKKYQLTLKNLEGKWFVIQMK